MTQEIMTAIKEADMVLVGLGEEFDNACHKNPKEQNKRKGVQDLLTEHEMKWLLPAYNSLIGKRNSGEGSIATGLKHLTEQLQDKNYFVVSIAMNYAIAQAPWREGRLVTPCGGMEQKQCVDGCQEGLQYLTESDRKEIFAYLEALQKEFTEDGASALTAPELGVCPKCGKPLVLNNIYAEHYDENGYLLKWQLYTKWLQGTLNRKLVILELGVGMKFPSVIRFPFEKVAFFNNKAYLYRINEKLYQLSEDLKGKGTAISKNSIDWLCSL